MGHIIFDLIIILGDIWVLFNDEDDSGISKGMAIIGIILLTISITMRVLDMTGIM